MVPGIGDDVAPLTEDEKKLYDKIEFDLDEYCKDVGVENLLHDSKARKLFLLCTLRHFSEAIFLVVLLGSRWQVIP